MKKNVRFKDIIREIKHTPGRFLSILLIIAVGVGFFSGFKATAPSIISSAEDYFNQYHLYDFELLSNIGFSDEDVAEVKKIDGVAGAKGSYSVDALVNNPDNREVVCKVLSIAGEGEDEINMPLITEGRMPEKENECVLTISQDHLESYSNQFKVGDTITIKEKAGKTDMGTILKERTYTISGIASLPQYFAYSMGTSSVGSGTIELAMMIPRSQFQYSRYTEMYVTLSCHEEGITGFEDAYTEILEKTEKALEKTGLTQYQHFISLSEAEIAAAEAQLAAGQLSAEQQLSDAQSELESAEEQITSGELELEEGETYLNQLSAETAARLQAARTELDTNWSVYNSAKAEYDASLATYNSSEAEYNESLEEYNSSYADYEAAREELEAHRSELSEAQILIYEGILANYKEILDAAKTELDSAKATLDEAKAKLDTANAQLISGKAQLDAGEAEYAAALAQAERELAAGQAQIDSGYSELDAAKSEYYYGLAQYNEAVQQAKTELDNGQNQIQNAKHSLTEVQDGKWYVLDREDAVENYANLKDDAQRLNSVSNIFPVFFLLIAVLVCLTTMMRMVDEQRMQIGTYKALGYKKREIFLKYVIYPGSAGLIGCIIGPSIFIAILPRVIFSIYSGTGGMYFLPWFNTEIPWLMLGIAVLIAMLCTILPAVFTCGKALSTPAASLMQPKAPKAGKRVFLERLPGLWQRLSFFRKLTVRNISRYKIRVLMSVIGIAGGLALMVAGFSLRDVITPLIDYQYNKLTHYDIMFYLNSSQSSESAANIQADLESDKAIDSTALLYMNEIKAYNNDQSVMANNTYLISPSDPEAFYDYQTFYDIHTGKEMKLDDQGAIITKKLSVLLDLKAGDEMKIKIGEHQYTIKVAGICENYLLHYIYMTPKYYQSVISSDQTYNMIFAQTNSSLTDKEAFREYWLTNSDYFSTIYFISDAMQIVEDVLNSLSLVVLVMIAAAGLLTFIVLYCLTNINIAERTREIATVKVLGFNARETNSYIFRENIIITAFALVLGCIAGFFLGRLMLNTVEVTHHYFYRGINWVSYIISIGLTIVFTIIVNLVMSRKIPKISMVESLKAIE